MKKSILITIAIVIAVVFGAYVYVKGTPQYSLYQLRKALADHNPERALKYVDIDAIAEGLIDRSMAEMASESKPDNQWEAAGQGFASAMILAMKPALKEKVRSEFMQQITTAGEHGGAISKLTLKDFPKTERDGDIALIIPPGETEPVFKMLKTEAGHWKIIELILPDQKGAQ